SVPGSPPQQPLGPATGAGVRVDSAPAFGAAKRSARLDRRTSRDLVDLSAMAGRPLCHPALPGPRPLRLEYVPATVGRTRSAAVPGRSRSLRPAAVPAPAR